MQDWRLVSNPCFWISITLAVSCGWVSEAQEREQIILADDLTVERLSDNVWRHISYQELSDFGRSPANGLVVLAGDEAILIDTP